jgi:hypothetical protein
VLTGLKHLQATLPNALLQQLVKVSADVHGKKPYHRDAARPVIHQCNIDQRCSKCNSRVASELWLMYNRYTGRKYLRHTNCRARTQRVTHSSEQSDDDSEHVQKQHVSPKNHII